MDKSDEKLSNEQLEDNVYQIHKLINEMYRRLKILDDVSMTLEKYPDIIDDKKALDDIRSIMKRTLEARAYARTLSSKEDQKDE